MEKLDLEALLAKNPHLDKKTIKTRHAELKNRSRRKPTNSPASPYGQQRGKRVGEDGWSEAVSRSYRSHFRSG
jgi:hypothetical protein